MTPPERPSVLSRRGALVCFPGIPIWLLVAFLAGFVAWPIANATQPTRPDWSQAVWIWIAVGYGLQVVGLTFGLLLPVLADACAKRRHMRSLNSWLMAYSWPMGGAGLGILMLGIPDEPQNLDVWAASATAYCFLVDMMDKGKIGPALWQEVDADTPGPDAMSTEPSGPELKDSTNAPDPYLAMRASAMRQSSPIRYGYRARERF